MRAGIQLGLLFSLLVSTQLTATASNQYVCHSQRCPRLGFASDLLLTKADNGTWKAKLTLQDDEREVFRTVGNYDGYETRSTGTSVVDFRWQTGVTSHNNRATPYELRVKNPERTYENYKAVVLEIKNSYEHSKPNICTYQCD